MHWLVALSVVQAEPVHRPPCDLRWKSPDDAFANKGSLFVLPVPDGVAKPLL